MMTAMPTADLPSDSSSDRFPAIDQIVYTDGIDTRYGFDVFDLDASPDRVNVVYAFTGPSGMLYVGAAPQLKTALEDSEMRRTARRMGACFLLVHTPSVVDFVPHTAAAERLIARYDPPLNRVF